MISSALERLWRRFRTPNGAAFLSFVFPGLGQAAAGRPSRGAIVAIPGLSVLGAFLLIVLLNRKSIFGAAVGEQWLASLIIADLLALVYHAWAIIDSYQLADLPDHTQPRRRRKAPKKASAFVGVGALLLATVVIHASIASFGLTIQHSLDCIQSETGACMFTGPTLAPGATIAMSTDDPGDVTLATDSPDPSASGDTPEPTTSIDSNATFDPSSLPSFDSPPDAKNWAADGQLNVLLAGIDSGGSGAGRASGLRPDTMIVLHIDLATGRSAMIGVPRNTQCVPLPQPIAAHYAKNSNGCPGYTYPNMLNWLANDAGWNHPTWFPFYQGQGYEYTRALTATQVAIETLTGLHIDGFAVINLEGMVKIIDDVGGITITVPKNLTAYDGPCGPKGTWAAQYRVCSLNPPHSGYPVAGPGVVAKMTADAASSNGHQKITASVNGGYDIGFVISAGTQHMSGDWALAYARTRIYSTDYNRMLRQQLVLKAMRQTLNPCSLLPQVPSLINDVGSAFWTNMPIRDDAPKWAGLAQHILGENVKSITLDPTTLGNSKSTYINATTWAKAKSIVAHSLDDVPASTPSGGNGGGNGGGFFTC
jgi:anionic cell wall polymer biosynthesis LytR-Cps2A-Psr (LCP) family protein